MNGFLRFVFTGLLIFFFAKTYSQPGVEYIKKATLLAQQKDFKGAIENYTKAIAANKNIKVIVTLLRDKRAVCETELKLYKEAIADENLAIAASPTYPLAYWNRGLAYSRTGEFQRGIDDYTKAIKFFTGDKRNLYILYDNRGSNWLSLRQFDKAIGDFTLAIDQGAQQGGAYWHRALAYGAKANYKGAADDYTTAMFYFNDNPAQMALLYDSRAVSKRLMKQYRESINDDNTAIKLNANDGNFYWHRGYTYQMNGDYKLAVDDYTTAIPFFQGNNQQSAYLYGNRAVNQIRLRESEKAIADASKAVSLMPEAGEPYYTRGSIYAQTGDNKLAIDDFDKAQQLYKDTYSLSFIHSQKATLYYVLKEYQKAADESTASIAQNPAQGNPYFIRGKALLKLGAGKDKAMADFNKVIALDTTKSSVDYIFSQFYTGHQELAMELLQQQVLQTPNPDDVLTHYYNIACMFSIMNKPDEANIYLKKAIDSGYPKKFAANDEDFDNIRKTPDYLAIMADTK